MNKIRYSDLIKQAVYENSCDCIKYGYGFSYLNKCGLHDLEAKSIWKQAHDDLERCF